MKEQLYELLPLFYREQDWYKHQPLRGLMAVLDAGREALNEDIENLYENWFIETCEERIIPYIADLVGVENLEEENLIKSERRYVANYIAYQRRNGTHNTLSNVLMDVSGFSFLAVDEYSRMATTWTPRDPSLKTPTFSVNNETGELGETPFNQNCILADLRTPESGSITAENGRVNLQTVALYAWRLVSLPVQMAQPMPVPNHHGRYYLNPFGHDISLSNSPAQPYNMFEDLSPWNYPVEINRGNYDAFCRSLDNEMSDDSSAYYPITIYQRTDQSDYIPMDQDNIYLADLKHWHKIKNVSPGVLVDPNLGRLMITDKELIGKIYVSYSYNSTTSFGAGPYNFSFYQGTNDRRIFVCPEQSMNGSYPDISTALDKWEPGISRIVLAGNNIYELNEKKTIDLNGSELTITVENNCQPFLGGDLLFINSNKEKPATVKFRSLNFKGTVTVRDNVNLEVSHCTFINDDESIIRTESTRITQRDIVITRSLLKNFVCPNNSFTRITNSVILTGVWESKNSFVEIIKSTILGGLVCHQVEKIVDSIITKELAVKDSSDVNVNYSYLGSLPDHITLPGHVVVGDRHSHKILHFLSQQIADGQFCLLSELTDDLILKGASDGEEMGVFNTMRLRLKEKNLRDKLAQYLPYGLEANLVYIN